ncbi:sulfotransferase domain-containing protein [Gammaproteobacteria bacterium]|nr:sulfotransferase domain-containing protein [Gammaproteobacteria bacterium]
MINELFSYDNIRRDLIQFGFVNFCSPPPERFVANSMPKAETNLLARALYLHPNIARTARKTVVNASSYSLLQAIERTGNGRFFLCHLRFNNDLKTLIQNLSLRHVVLIRDPRDVVISYFHYVQRERGKHFMFKQLHKLSHLDALQAICYGIEGSLLPVSEIFDEYAAWAIESDALILRYEDLITDTSQLATLRQLYQFINVCHDETLLNIVAPKRSDRSSRTFRKGMAGAYKNELPEYLSDAIVRESKYFSKFYPGKDS